jgi:ribonuclease VapC
MFFDASAIVAILSGEPEQADLAARIDAARPPLYVSPTATFEAVLSLAAKVARQTGAPLDAALVTRAQEIVAEFLADLGVKDIMITAEIGRKAIEAAKRYSKAVGHPAALNFGDCFAYACARAYRVPLLFKGQDFSRTDIETA